MSSKTPLQNHKEGLLEGTPHKDKLANIFYNIARKFANCCIDRFDNVIKQLVHAAAVRMSRY